MLGLSWGLDPSQGAGGEGRGGFSSGSTLVRPRWSQGGCVGVGAVGVCVGWGLGPSSQGAREEDGVYG